MRMLLTHRESEGLGGEDVNSIGEVVDGSGDPHE